MKQFHRFSVATSLFVLSTLLLCFSSCQSSDTKSNEGDMVSSIPLTVRIGSTSSRVGMIDAYDDAFSCFWNSDKLNIYHQYMLNGKVQSMIPLEFGTSATSGTSAAFSYTGTSSYYYNPGSRLYAFSSGTSGGYTASVTDAGVSTLTAPTLASQNGSLSDCAKYDALYGSALVNSTTGLPESLTMNHLFGILNLHLTCNSFSTSYAVTVTLTFSASNILPGNIGNASLAADGTTLTRTGSWNNTWSGTITPTSNGVVDVYLMTWPFSSANGTLTVSCSDASGNTNYTPNTMTLNDFSLNAAQLKSKSLAITSAPV